MRRSPGSVTAGMHIAGWLQIVLRRNVLFNRADGLQFRVAASFQRWLQISEFREPVANTIEKPATSRPIPGWLTSRQFDRPRHGAVMPRQRYLLIGIIGTRHRPYGTIAGRWWLCFRRGVDKCLNRWKFGHPVVVAFPIHGEGRLRAGKQCDDREHPHGMSIGLASRRIHGSLLSVRPSQIS